ncbi:exoribonuclease II [Malassezia cuniculi]|uniref:Exoribonuclease II n=1 Tax=Malassezia cuniculi TaxID=948313 RepID=A0AAF0EW16_9BASI|nr:exoribonuclease II [Malassezia cuniculi]
MSQTALQMEEPLSGKRRHDESDKRKENKPRRSDNSSEQRGNSGSNGFHGIRYSGPVKLDPSVLQKNDTSIVPSDLTKWDKRDASLQYNVDDQTMIAANMGEVTAGDFVEIRRSGRTFCGVAMPMLDDEEYVATGKMNMLAVVVATGEMELVKSTDVMLQFPAFVDMKLALAAAPLKRDHVVATRAAEVNNDSFASDTQNSPKILTPEREPVDQKRFHARAQICYKIRLLQRNADNAIRDLFPSFRTLMLQERFAEDLDLDAGAATPSSASATNGLLIEARDLLQSGSVSTVDAAALVYRHSKTLLDPKLASDLRLSADTLYAVHVLLMSHPLQFIADTTSHRRSQLFTYRSAEEQRNLLRVIAWVRDTLDLANLKGSDGVTHAQKESKAIIDGFCSRARHVIAWAESQNLVTVAIGESGFASKGPAAAAEMRVPALDGTGDFEWTANDKDIIAFLKASLGNRREIQEDPIKSITMAIIKLVGAHVHLDPIVHDRMLEVPLKIKNMEKIKGLIDTQRAEPVPDTTTGIHDGGYDLQQALVYNFLVRLGAIAPWENPNSLDLYLKHYEAAAQVFESKHAQDKDLLQSSNMDGMRKDFGSDPVYVIDSETASELDDGVSISPTNTPDEYWLHVHIADPTALIQPHTPLAQLAERRYTSIYFPEEHYSMLPEEIVMGKMSLKRNDEHVSNEGQHVLTFSTRICVTNGKVLDFDVKPSIVHNVKTLSYNSVNEIYPEFFTGSPAVKLDIMSFEDDFMSTGTFDGLPGGISAETMVSELMILTGRVAATIGIERDIPLPFRIQEHPTEEQIAIIENAKHPLTAAMPITTLQEHQIFLPSAVFSKVPGPHYALGIRPMSKSSSESDALYHGG